ncbi:MAG TPA: hypothetical protein ENG99_00705 [bacterium]|nr:hypothetical protein [bacterium]
MKFKIFSILFFCFIFFALSFSFVSAYSLLQPLPGIQGGDSPNLSQYLSWIFHFALAAAAFLAVLKIIIGAMNIVVGGASETARKKGKEMIEMALWGLLLAISSVLILSTINPDLVKKGLTIPGINIENENSGNDSGNGNSSVNCWVVQNGDRECIQRSVDTGYCSTSGSQYKTREDCCLDETANCKKNGGGTGGS